MNLVKFKYSIRTHMNRNSLFDTLVQKTMSIPNYQNLQSDCELITFLCNSVENGLKSGVKIDKKQLVLDILNKVFPNLSTEELAFINNIIQNLNDRGGIVKITQYYSFFLSVINYFLQK
jgi:hypothetical protein